MIKTKNKSRIAVTILSLALMAVNAGAYDLFGSDRRGFGNLTEEVKGTQVDTRHIQPSTGSTVSNDLVHFWEDLKMNSMDSICKNAQIKLNQDAKLPNVGGIGGKFARYLKQYPDTRLALVDEVGVKLDAAIGHEVLDIPGYGGLNIGIGASVEGESMVVRPLESMKYCKELGTLVDLRDVKTVLPINQKRISDMKAGEIWKMPFIVRYSFSAGVGAPVTPLVTVSVGGGISKEKRPSVSLFRMNDNTIRLRIRIERIEVKSINAGVSTTFVMAPGDIGLFQAENILTKAANKAIAGEINKFLAARIVYGHSNTSGKKVLLEFLINPNDKQQLDALVEFLAGDYGVIKKFLQLGLKVNEFSEKANSTDGSAALDNVTEQAENALGVDASFAGANHYHGHSDNLNINVPLIHSHESSWTSSYNRYQTMKEEDGVMHVNQAGKVSNGSSVNIPFVGTMIKYNSDKNVYVINKEASDNSVSNPVLLFQHNVGFVRQDEGVARNMIQRMNNVLKYASVDGNGTSDDLILPVDQIFPASQVPADYDPFGNEPKPSKTYRASVVSFRLMFSKAGVQEILVSPAERILKAYLNVMKEAESEILNKVRNLFFINKKGVVDYDRGKAAKILGVDSFPNNDGGINPLDIMRDMAYTATCVIKDIFSVRDGSDWKAQSERLSNIGAGRGKSKMGFEDFFKVAIQLVSRNNISAEVYVHTDKRIKGESDVDQNYSYLNSRDNNFNSTIGEVNAMRDRFAEPSTLSD